jgi:two-component system phosphate regulon sensor histidine kinase PhoR
VKLFGSIQVRLIITYVVLIFFSTTVTWLFFLPRIRAWLEQRTIDQLISQSRILGNVISGNYSYADGNLALVADGLRGQFKNVSAMRVRLYDMGGLLVADTRGEVAAANPPALPAEERAALSGQQITWVQPGDERVVHVVSPLKAPVGVFGAVDISSPVRDEETMRAVGQIMGLALVVSVLASWFLAFLLSRTILTPIDRLRRAADRIAGGNLSQRVEVGRDELGMLGQAINHMAAQLQGRIEEIVGQKNTMNSLLETLLDGVVALDRAHRIRFLNRVAERMLATPAETAIGRPLVELVPDVELAPRLAECLERKRLVSWEAPFREAIVRFYLLPFEDEQGRHLGTMAVLHDVTELRRLEEARSQFFGSVSHELRTPLTIIKGFASNQLDNERVLEDPVLKRSLEMIDRETDRLSRLVDDILELSRLRSRKMRVELREVDAPVLLRETLEAIETHASRAGIGWSWAVDGGGPATIQADPDRFRQIFINLVDNAIKYTPVGGEVRVATAREDGRWRVDVSDTGAGIPAEEIPYLFERFFRGRDTQRKDASRGTGLGLAIVRELVDAHGGRIRVESEPGRGTTVHVDFPLADGLR